jgi:hypothetical protein
MFSQAAIPVSISLFDDLTALIIRLGQLQLPSRLQKAKEASFYHSTSIQRLSHEPEAATFSLLADLFLSSVNGMDDPKTLGLVHALLVLWENNVAAVDCSWLPQERWQELQKLFLSLLSSVVEPVDSSEVAQISDNSEPTISLIRLAQQVQMRSQSVWLQSLHLLYPSFSSCVELVKTLPTAMADALCLRLTQLLNATVSTGAVASVGVLPPSWIDLDSPAAWSHALSAPDCWLNALLASSAQDTQAELVSSASACAFVLRAPVLSPRLGLLAAVQRILLASLRFPGAAAACQTFLFQLSAYSELVLKAAIAALTAPLAAEEHEKLASQHRQQVLGILQSSIVGALLPCWLSRLSELSHLRKHDGPSVSLNHRSWVLLVNLQEVLASLIPVGSPSPLLTLLHVLDQTSHLLQDSLEDEVEFFKQKLVVPDPPVVVETSHPYSRVDTIGTRMMNLVG